MRAVQERGSRTLIELGLVSSLGSGRGHEAEAAGQGPCHAGGEDEPDAGHEDEDAEDAHGDFEVGTGVAEEQEADAEQDEHRADLDRVEDAGDGVWHALAGVDGERDGGGFEEALAGFGLHVGGELLAGAEFVNEAGVDLALQLEDAAPAAVVDEEADGPDGGAEEGGEGQQGGRVAEELVKAGAALLVAVDL